MMVQKQVERLEAEAKQVFCKADITPSASISSGEDLIEDKLIPRK
jgi:hypothetical protein